MTLPLIPNVSNFRMSFLWETLSKALLKSVYITSYDAPSSNFVIQSSKDTSNCKVHDLPGTIMGIQRSVFGHSSTAMGIQRSVLSLNS